MTKNILYMTLIAATLNYNRPVVISDTLVTAEGVKCPILLPGVDNGYFQHLAKGKRCLPMALRQKMYIVNRNICIVFAGDEPEIKIFIFLFKEYFPENSVITNDRIHEFLKVYGLDQNFKESSFLIFYAEKAPNNKLDFNQFYLPNKEFVVNQDRFTTEDGKWNILEEPVYEKTWAHASGTNRFLNLINQPMLAESKFPNGDMMRAIQMNTILIAKLHALQTIAENYYSLVDDWGGAFEIAYFNGQSFEKLDKYAYLICYSQFDESGNIGVPIPMYVLYYRYVKGALFITELSGAFEMSENDTQIIFTAQCGNYKVRVFKILGVDIDENSKIPKMPDDLSFSTNTIAVGYSLITKKDTIVNPAFFNLGPEVKVIYRQGKHVKIFIDKSINEDIREWSKKHYREMC